MQAITDVVSAVGNSLMVLQPAMVDAAITAGVRHFYPSEWNSNISQKGLYALRYFREKQAARSYLRSKAESTPGFQYTLVLTAPFTEWAVDDFYGFNHRDNNATIYGSTESRVGVTSIPDIVKCTIESLQIPFEGACRTLRVQGWSGPVKQLVSFLEQARGVAYHVTSLDPAEAKAIQEKARLEGDDIGEMTANVKPLLAGGFAVADATGPLDSLLFDFEPEQPLETFKRVFRVHQGRHRDRWLG